MLDAANPRNLGLHDRSLYSNDTTCMQEILQVVVDMNNDGALMREAFKLVIEVAEAYGQCIIT